MWKRDQINDQRHSMAMPKDEMRTSIKNPLSNLGRIYYHVSRKTRGTPSVSGSIITAKQEGLRPLIRKQEIVSGLQTHSTILLTRTKKRSKNQKIKISYHVQCIQVSNKKNSNSLDFWTICFRGNKYYYEKLNLLKGNGTGKCFRFSKIRVTVKSSAKEYTLLITSG